MNDNDITSAYQSDVVGSQSQGASPSLTRDPAVSRARVGFRQGKSPRLNDETAALLRSRLQASSIVLAVILGIVFVANLFTNEVPFLWLRIGIVIVLATDFAFLYFRSQLSLRTLRYLELCVYGPVMLQITLLPVVRVIGYAENNDVASTIMSYSLLQSSWAMCILLYGIFIPNSWRRAAVITLPAALVPFLTDAFIRLQSETTAAIIESQHVSRAAPLSFLAAIAAICAAHTMYTIRREEFKARELGQYRLKEKLGTGGMGEVYRAEHLLLKRTCAVKLIKMDHSVDASALDRFEREVRSTAKLTHWNTVEIYDYGRTDDGTFYYVMELLPGLSFEQIVNRYGPMPPERVVHLLTQVCRALHEAHAIGLVHRDLKPANLFSSQRGGVWDVAKVLDFGLVKDHSVPEADDSNLTQAGTFSGSPLYMSPEQATDFSTLDVRSDIYSLGAVAYFILTGQPPFPGTNPMQIIIAHSRDEATPLSKVIESMPRDLEQVVLRCLAKKPEDRFESVQHLGKALLSCECAGIWDEASAEEWWSDTGVLDECKSVSRAGATTKDNSMDETSEFIQPTREFRNDPDATK